jgi:hypothetical protein
VFQTISKSSERHVYADAIAAKLRLFTSVLHHNSSRRQSLKY